MQCLSSAKRHEGVCEGSHSLARRNRHGCPRCIEPAECTGALLQPICKKPRSCRVPQLDLKPGQARREPLLQKKCQSAGATGVVC